MAEKLIVAPLIALSPPFVYGDHLVLRETTFEVVSAQEAFNPADQFRYKHLKGRREFPDYVVRLRSHRGQLTQGEIMAVNTMDGIARRLFAANAAINDAIRLQTVEGPAKREWIAVHGEAIEHAKKQFE